MKNFKVYAMMFAMLPIFSFAQDDGKYVMVETIQLKVKSGANADFEKAVKEHNDKYHPEGTPYEAWLEVITTGPNTGTYVWLMGPTTFTHLDTRPDGAHDDDWTKNVTKHVTDVTMGEYWKKMEDISTSPEDAEETTLSEIWFVDVKKGEFYRFEAVMEKVKAVEEKRGGSMNVWSNVFNANDGRDVAISWSQKSWASFDDDSNFKKLFEEMYGEGSWMKLIDEWEDCIDAISQEVWANVE